MAQVTHSSLSQVERGILELFFIVSCLIFISAGLIHEAESEGYEDNFWAFHNTLYFIIVSLSTVGYGDMSPSTELGRGVMTFIICAGLVIVPLQTSRVVELAGLERKVHSQSIIIMSTILIFT